VRFWLYCTPRRLGRLQTKISRKRRPLPYKISALREARPVGWHELQSNNPEEAFAFYASLFGWTKAQAIDMGPLGVYQLFATGGEPVGGMMTRCEGMPPFRLYYFNVEGIGAAVSRVTDKGGRITNGPHQVPG